MNTPRPPSPLRNPAQFDRALSDLAMIAVHEAGAMSDHLACLRTRIRVTRRARSIREAMQFQLDLWPDTAIRLRRDREMRRNLMRTLVRDITRQPQATRSAARAD